MLFLLGGFLVLCGVLLLVYLFVNADPGRLARGLKWTGIGIAVLAVAGLFVSGRLAALLFPLAMMMPLLSRLKSIVDRWRGPAGGQTSTVSTPTLRMSLDHETGEMTGTVLSGRFAGMRLEELGKADLLELLRECRAEDEQGARLLEAYLDRLHPSWREEFAGAGGRSGPAPAAEMSVEEAYEVLGLRAGAGAAEIREAHHRLMKMVHPDLGGSDYLATKINRARDVLLGHH
jgi:hypothetical protein